MCCVENVSSKCLEHNFIILYLLYEAESYAIIFTKSGACILVTLCCKQESHQLSSLEFKTTILLLHNSQGWQPGKDAMPETTPTFQQEEQYLLKEVEVILTSFR